MDLGSTERKIPWIDDSLSVSSELDSSGTLRENEIDSCQLESFNKLQKVNPLYKFVPYSHQLECTRVELWHRLKSQLCEAILKQGDDCREWIFAFNEWVQFCHNQRSDFCLLSRYLNVFGFAFSKEEHVEVIHLCWDTLMELRNDFVLMRALIKLLARLLK